MAANRDDLIAQLWQRLGEVAQQPGHPWRTPVLGTISVDGRPSVRTVVLRRVKLETYTLIAHTDVRSPKVSELRLNAATEWLFYDSQTQVQLRLRGKTRVVTAEEYEGAWETTPMLLRPNYSTPMAPGSPLPGVPEDLDVDPNEGKENFALICCEVQELDWLQLNPKGHERIQFSREGLDWRGTWVVP